MPKFEKTYCSQCGGEFGPSDSGFSHCSTHAMLSRIKANPAWGVREIERLQQRIADLENEKSYPPEDAEICPACGGQGFTL
jgi:hypothetical protein